MTNEERNRLLPEGLEDMDEDFHELTPQLQKHLISSMEKIGVTIKTTFYVTGVVVDATSISATIHGTFDDCVARLTEWKKRGLDGDPLSKPLVAGYIFNTETRVLETFDVTDNGCFVFRPDRRVQQ